MDAETVGSYAGESAVSARGSVVGVFGMASGWRGRQMVWAAVAAVACGHVRAQLCTTQAKLQPALRETLAKTALELGSAVRAADVNVLRTGTIASVAENFAGTEALVRATSAQLAGDSLEVTQLYVLDATGRTGSEAGSADFACPLSDVAASETDFSINGLPAGRFSFAMVEAGRGPHPWLLAFLLQQDAGNNAAWKMAGFYPHPRTAGGHAGLWYWTDARARVAEKQPWLAWLEYGAADTLLRPASFVSSTHLDALRTEQRAAAPPGLAEGISAESPLVLKAPAGGEFRITQMSAEATDGDGPLRLLLHVAAAGTDPAAMRTQGTAAAQTLLATHPELRPAFTGLLVLVDPPSGSPEVLSLPMSSLR